MEDLKGFVNRVLLPVQLSLGLFQIMKNTPLWAVIHCALASLLNFFRFPYTDYKSLKQFRGRVYKKVISHTTTAGTKAKKQKDSEKSQEQSKKEDESEKSQEQSKKEDKSEEQTKKEDKSEDEEQFKKEVVYLGKEFVLDRNDGNRASVLYLGKEFVLERNDGNKMLMKDGPAYIITDKMWKTVKYIENVAPKAVFLKNHKEIWEEVVTGDIMEFQEVLDSVILDNRAVIRLDPDYFLPVNLVRSAMKLTTTLNFVGLFLKTQNHIYWLIPALLTFVSVIMGFSTTLRFWIGRHINTIFCKSLQMLCDLLPSPTRRRIYSLGNCVDNLKPGNDLKSKTVRGTAILLVAAGARLDAESFADHETLDDRDPTRVLVGGGAKVDADSISVVVRGAISDLQTSTYCESLDRLLIVADKSSIRTFLAGGTKVQPDDRSEDIWPQVGPFLFKCESVYIEWIFDNTSQICSLKAGRVAPRESLIARDVCIHVCDHTRKNPVKLLKFGGKEYNKSLIADDLDTSSVDVECSSSEEAIKLLRFAFYMAKFRTTSLKSYDRENSKVTVRRFVESINAYASSGYPPLYRLIVDDVVVR